MVKKQLKLRGELPEQRFEVEDEVSNVKKVLAAMKTGAFQSKLYGSCQVVIASFLKMNSSKLVQKFLQN